MCLFTNKSPFKMHLKYRWHISTITSFKYQMQARVATGRRYRFMQ